jgi:hypothetical protein
MSIVQVKMTEVLDHLRENGEIQKAVNALIAKKGGAAASSVTVVNDLGGSGLSDSQLGNVAGGAQQTLMAGGGLVLQRPGLNAPYQIPDKPRFPGGGGAHCDTSW